MNPYWNIEQQTQLQQRIAALKAQNARLLALVREALTADWIVDDETMTCNDCGAKWHYDSPTPHTLDCWHTRAHRALVALDTAAEDGT